MFQAIKVETLNSWDCSRSLRSASERSPTTLGHWKRSSVHYDSWVCQSLLVNQSFYQHLICLSEELMEMHPCQQKSKDSYFKANERT